MNKNLDGKKGDDITVLVPLGTTIIDTTTQEAIEILEKNVPVLIAKGGLGQSGNHDGNLPEVDSNGVATAPPEQLGEEKELHLVLNLIADIGLIGFPNAGKSSLLKSLTRADPKIGNYPFTTLEPNLGVLLLNSDKRLVLADIPGLVEGASLGKGLGIQFLKHIQKTKILLHCIDATASNLYNTYKAVRKEFEDYDKTLLNKKEIILLTKTDLIDKKMLEQKIKELKKTKREIIPISIYEEKSITELKERLTQI